MTNKTATKYGKQVVRHNRELKMVRLGLMKVSPLCQRELKRQWVDELVSKFDIDKLGSPEVSHRDGYFYIMDGQHRLEAVKKFLGKGWEEQHVQCWVAEGLTEEQEADVFLSLNDRKAVDVFSKYKVGLRAGRPTETAVERVVREQGLITTTQQTPGAVRAVGTLMKVYKRSGEAALRRGLRLANESFGDPGLDATIIDGFSLLCHRYNGVLDEQSTIRSLEKVRGGVNGILGLAEQIRQKTGAAKAQCVAATAVTIVNRDRKKKLPSWFKD